MVNDSILIKRVDNVEDCKACNNMYAELVLYESAFDDLIVPQTQIENYYERILNKDDCAIFLAKSDNSNVGYVMAYINPKKDNVKLDVVNILHLYVKPEYRIKGIAKMLMKQVENWAKSILGSCVLELNCFVDNDAAMEFYSKMQFKKLSVKLRKKI